MDEDGVTLGYSNGEAGDVDGLDECSICFDNGEGVVVD